MDTANAIKRTFEKHQSKFEGYDWVYENQRWKELVFCLLSHLAKQKQERVRALVEELSSLDLISMDNILQLGQPNSRIAVVFTYILDRYGFSQEEIRKSSHLLLHIATIIHKEYDDKIHRYVRQRAQSLRDDLTDLFTPDGLDKQGVRFAVSLWLQNCFNLPISLEHEAVKMFCKKMKINMTEFVRAVDTTDLNLAVVDDVLYFEMTALARTTQRNRK